MISLDARSADTTSPLPVVKAAFEGIEGSYSHGVLDAYGERRGVAFVPVGQRSYRQVAQAVLSGAADVGLLPVDNAIAGTIREGYDVLAEYELDLLAEITVRMEHRLLGVPGATLESVREVISHPIVLVECGRFLGTLAARQIPEVDTGVAAREVAEAQDPGRAAIASADAAKRYGLVELAQTIADHPDNFTRFILFRAPRATGIAAEFEPASDVRFRKTTLTFSVADHPGSLGQCLTILGDHGLNLTKLDSKLRLGSEREYLFYADVQGDVRDQRFADALVALREHTATLHVLGSYDASTAPPRVRREHAVVVDRSPMSAPEVGTERTKLPKVAREESGTHARVVVGNVVIGEGTFVVAAGPCSVESREQILATAEAVAGAGAMLLRGGAFKPRTSPYAFQGLGWEGVELLAEARRLTGLPVVSEVMSIDQVEGMAAHVDMLQIGARNMQNFDLLKAVGKTDRPVLLKRGMAATIDELLAAAEYIAAEGNPNVVLCERGIRTFETATRNTLDLSAVPVLRERTHLPILVDPSHAVGVRRWIAPLCRAAKAVGAHGLLVEVHPNPAVARCDADQALTFDDFAKIMNDLAELPIKA